MATDPRRPSPGWRPCTPSHRLPQALKPPARDPRAQIGALFAPIWLTGLCCAPIEGEPTHHGTQELVFWIRYPSGARASCGSRPTAMRRCRRSIQFSSKRSVGRPAAVRQLSLLQRRTGRLFKRVRKSDLSPERFRIRGIQLSKRVRIAHLRSCRKSYRRLRQSSHSGQGPAFGAATGASARSLLSSAPSPPSLRFQITPRAFTRPRVRIDAGGF